MNWKNILERAFWASVASSVSAIPVAQITAAVVGADLAALEQLVLSAVGAFAGGLFSFLKTISQERLEVLTQRGEHEAV